jgi:UDPglucose--hexose-1-phosphate uridylyltransferase
MSTLRRDPITGRWVINTDKLKDRATSLNDMEDYDKKKICPFCEGNENLTPPEIFAFRKEGSLKDQTGWEVRVVPNISPALKSELDLDRRPELMYDLMNSVGAHEIIIETNQHITNLADLAPEQIKKVLEMYKFRLEDLKKDKRFKSIVIFKNYGERAGSSPIKHSHSQLIAMPVTPKALKEELFGAKDYYDYKSRCVFCDMIKQELYQKKRIISENQNFVCFAPFASRFTHETWILPKKHFADFESMDEKTTESLAFFLKDILQRIKIFLKDPPYNYILHTGPNRVQKKNYWQSIDADFHWHFEIMPRFTRIAGFEWGTGFYINATTPEEAAEDLRSVVVEAESR